MQDIFGNSVRKIVKRVSKSVQRAFENLSKRSITLISQSDIDLEQEWCTLRHNAPAIAKESGDGKWETLISNQFDITFGRFEESRCDDRVMVSEVSFHKNSQEKKIQMKIVYDQFTVSPQLTKTINHQLSGLPIMERAKSVMSLLDTSYVCHGFLASENSETLELYKVKVQKHLITEQLSSGNITENRVFSSACEVFTNSAGKTCSKCATVKWLYNKKEKRKQQQYPLHPKTNHRYMSKEELVEKVAIEKKAKEKEKTKREELEAEMIALEEEDHSDLKAIMSNVNKENVPDDMKLLWEQQESILKASSVKGYRWHPR